MSAAYETTSDFKPARLFVSYPKGSKCPPRSKGLPLGFDYNVDPRSLFVSQSDHRSVFDVYSRYEDDLASFTAEMTKHRRGLIGAGFSCDFSDRESELLYLLVRALQPSTVVEISPRHGYSTNYILGALTHNGKGELHSFEIVDKIQGKPAEKVIRNNQLPWLDQTRLHIHIEDATRATIPDPDILFLDSAHESWFASWYFSSLVPRSKICLVHDIIIAPPTHRTLVPKGPFLGVRESIQALQTLGLNGQKILSVAEFARYSDGKFSKPPAARYPGAAERSIIFGGHDQTPEATQVHLALTSLRRWQHSLVDGDRSVIDEDLAVLNNEMPLYGRLAAGILFPLAGYRDSAMRAEFGAWYSTLINDVRGQLDSVSDFVAALELGTLLWSPPLVSGALARGREVLPRPIYNFFASHYRKAGRKTRINRKMFFIS